jgi:ATP-dependent Lon protease
MESIEVMDLPLLVVRDVVLFPNAVLPLQIVQPHEKRLVEEALREERFIGVVLAKPDWDPRPGQPVSVHAVGTVASIVEHQEGESETMQVVLRGHRRFEISADIQSEGYPTARVRLLNEVVPADQNAAEMAKEMVELFREMANLAPRDSALNLLAHLDFPSLVNCVCTAINMPVGEKQRLLELEDLGARSQLALAILREQVNQARLIADFRHLQPRDPRLN